jgi:hypothetical protein
MKTKIQNKITLAKRVWSNFLRLFITTFIFVAGLGAAKLALYTDLTGTVQYIFIAAAAVALGVGLHDFLKFLDKE